MRIAFLSWRVVILALATAPLVPLIAQADPLESTSPEPILSDPRPQDSHAFPPGIATSGAADPGHQVSVVPAQGHAGCDGANPCAAAPQPLAHVTPPPPANPH